jgi:hypothetical protein
MSDMQEAFAKLLDDFKDMQSLMKQLKTMYLSESTHVKVSETEVVHGAKNAMYCKWFLLSFPYLLAICFICCIFLWLLTAC